MRTDGEIRSKRKISEERMVIGRQLDKNSKDKLPEVATVCGQTKARQFMKINSLYQWLRLLPFRNPHAFQLQTSTKTIRILRADINQPGMGEASKDGKTVLL